MKKIKWISIISLVVLFCGAFSWKAFALEYIYDDLNRLISAKEDSGQTMHYEYDAAGNLLTVTASSGIDGEGSINNGVSEGWSPYFTSGVTANYELVIENEEIETEASASEEELTTPETESSAPEEESTAPETEGITSEEELIAPESENSESEEVLNTADTKDSGTEAELNLSDVASTPDETENNTPEPQVSDPEMEPFPSDTEINNSETQLDAPETEDTSSAVQRISAQASVPGGANVYRDIEVVGSNSYTIKGSVKAESLTNAVAQIIVNYYDQQGQLIGHDNVFNLLEVSDWTSFDQSLNVPEDAVTARIHLQLLLQSNDSAGVAGFTNIQFDSAMEP